LKVKIAEGCLKEPKHNRDMTEDGTKAQIGFAIQQKMLLNVIKQMLNLFDLDISTSRFWKCEGAEEAKFIEID
jgi:hypothetical protein